MGKPRTVETALELGEWFLGRQGYKEIDNGVFRSLDGLSQFRVTSSDLAGKGMKVFRMFTMSGLTRLQIKPSTGTP
jgi:hypothetical protein